MRQVAFRILTPLMAVVVLLVALETAMRAAATWIWRRPKMPESAQFSPANEFRIIAIGESTTAQVMLDGEDVSWPGQLEKILNQAGLGRSFKVINLGMPATSTPYLLRELETKLPEIRPNLVVSMMGINGNIAYEFLHESSWWGSLRVVKLGRWIWASMQRDPAKALPPAKPDRETEQRLADFMKGLDATLTDGNLGKARTMAAEMAARYPSQRWLIDKMTGTRLKHASYVIGSRPDHPHGDPSLANRVSDLAIKYLRESFELNPLDSEVMSQILFFYEERNRPELARGFVQLGVSRGLVMDGPSLTVMPMLFGANDPLVKSVLEKQGIRVNNRASMYSSLVQDYRRVATLLKAHHIAYIAMQYPTGKIGSLREIFSERSAEELGRRGSFGEAMYQDVPDVAVSPEYGHVIFASNENFNDIVDARNESKYFLDKFARPFHRFGHTTKIGSVLIASNLAKVVVANWGELKNETSRP